MSTIIKIMLVPALVVAFSGRRRHRGERQRVEAPLAQVAPSTVDSTTSTLDTTTSETTTTEGLDIERALRRGRARERSALHGRRRRPRRRQLRARQRHR